MTPHLRDQLEAVVLLAEKADHDDAARWIKRQLKLDRLTTPEMRARAHDFMRDYRDAG